LANHSGDIRVLKVLRPIIKAHPELDETIKWGIPCYTFKGKNVLGLAIFKNFSSIWFYQGALLQDPANILTNAQEGKTKAMRHWKFTDLDNIDAKMINSYVKEAIEVFRNGKEIKPSKQGTKDLPLLLQNTFSDDLDLKKSFDQFTNYKKNEFIEYIQEAKRESTKLKRLEKIIQLIKEGIGLNDKYRK